MLKIKKTTNDPLRGHRSAPNATYENIPTSVRSTLQDSLLKEQGYLCCYCMKRIVATSMSVEHWKPRSKFPELALDYDNLLAVCDGNQGQSPKDQHCDTQKGNKTLSLNPADPNHASRLKIRYLPSTGKIESADCQLAQEIDSVLNLNHALLLASRKEVISRVRKWLSSLPPNASKAAVQQGLNLWQTCNEHRLPEYAGVAIYFLQKRLGNAR